MIILGIESSCDETAAAIVKDGWQVLSSEIASQVSIHQEFGGVVPEIAARAHLQNIEPVVSAALKNAQITLNDVDAIAVTQGPGLIGALLVGVSYAKGLALATRKPLIPVDHVHAHIYGALLDQAHDLNLIFPCLGLVASGGHTNLYYMPSATTFELIAWSDDDACGESFDKVAKLLGFSYPGGPAIERAAAQASGDLPIPMPTPVEQKDRLRFSYSGLKTHMANLIRKSDLDENQNLKAHICKAFQDNALEQLVRKIAVAAQKYPQSKSLLIAGGVAANQRFRNILHEHVKLQPIFPNLAYCSDNAAMIAGFAHALHGVGKVEHFEVPYQWDAYSRYDYGSVIRKDDDL